ncbi:hypothetical protein AM500_22030 [Bacillus sp. FJAT-18017]|uniref:LTA synthase family protein n=1 Tax=Bacillus sp. FJAT-18017 TaxID=1705566 RepID=UPI0006ADC877|nr:alkaline phosphatase family protein [Bacillus sp. FJAT-18017]ALC92153.1 hypothetical protein AM500_22030 [Bacillus sp. FJAT-18017]
MAEIAKRDSLLIFYFVSIAFIDLTFRLGIFEDFYIRDYVLSLIFILALAFLFHFINSFFRGAASHVIACLILLFVTVLYASQFMYYQFFRTFYSVYSAGNGAQVFEFWKDIRTLLVENIVWLGLFMIPLLLLVFWGRRLLSFQRLDKFNRVSIALCFVIAQIAGIGTVFASGKGINSAYDLYYRNSLPLLSMEKLGLVTTMRLDMQRMVTGWSPRLEASADDIPLPAEDPLPDSPDAEPEKPEEYNVMNIDFEAMARAEKNQDLKSVHSYFSKVLPTEKNEYTGKFKGYNLIFITAEGFSPYAVNKEVTPTLYKLIHRGYNFTNFYNPIWGVSTSDGEYVATLGLIPKSGVWSFQESGRNLLPFAMGNQLKKLGYKTMAYHNHTYTYYRRDLSHPNMGYEYKGLGNGLNVKETWPESDLEMIEKTVPEYIGKEPFHAYYMTVSGHMQYSFTGNYIAWKNKKHVDLLSLSNQAKAYLATQIELDRALESLLSQLEQVGVAEKTLIALSADHYPYGLDPKTINELAGHKVEENFELYRSPFILYSKGMEPEVIDKPASSLDIIPTLSNLLGLDYDSRLLMGQDIFSEKAPLVIFMNKSFITDKGRYNAVTSEYLPVPGVSVDQKYINTISSIVQSKFYYSAKILELDYYRKIFPSN